MPKLKKEFIYCLLALITMLLLGVNRCQQSTKQFENSHLKMQISKMFVYDRFVHMPSNIRKSFRMHYGKRTTTSVCSFLANNPHITILEYKCDQGDL